MGSCWENYAGVGGHIWTWRAGGWRRSVTGKPPANAFIPQGPPLTHESRRCLTYLFIQQMLIKQVFSAKNSAGLRAQQRSEVPLALTLLTEAASCFALISHPSPTSTFTRCQSHSPLAVPLASQASAYLRAFVFAVPSP